MSCIGVVCGTGAWTGPLPGDPSNDIVLSAQTAYGGIQISVSYPTIHPEAVAYFRLFRSTTSDFNTAVERYRFTGTGHLDTTPTDASANVTYYYWIQLVSTYGTHSAWVGPASAIAYVPVAQMIELLTGRIDNSSLAIALKSDIDQIAVTQATLVSETANRVASNAALSVLISDVQSGLVDAAAFMNTEVINRTSEDSALMAELDTIAALNADTAALIATDYYTKVDTDSAIALAVVDLNAASVEYGSAIADIQTAKIGYSAEVAGAPYDGNKSTIVYPVATYPSVDYPEYVPDRTRIIDKIGVTNWNLTPAGIAKPLIWVVGMPMASAIKTVSVMGPDGTAASLETAMTAQKDLNGDFKALYTAKVSVNGLVGGFGIYNDGTTVDAGFDVNTFWVGSTNLNKRKPFIIDAGVTYIDDAAIRSLTFDKLRASDGSLVVQGGLLTANYIDARGLSIKDTSGNIILAAGTALANTTFNIPGIVNNTPAGWLNSNVTATGIGAVQTSLANAPAAILNSSVSLGTLGYTGATNATANQSDATTNNAISSAQTTAISTASSDATTKANTAQSTAITATTSIALVGRNGMTVSGNKITKTSGGAGWDADAYSVDSYTGGAYASAQCVDLGSIMFGLNTDPLTDASYGSIDYAWYLAGGSRYIYESGGNPWASGTYAVGDVFSVTYDGTNVRYYHNGTLCRTVAANITNPIFFDSSFVTVGTSLKNIQFGPMSSNAWSSVGGVGKPADYANYTTNTNQLTDGANLGGTASWSSVSGRPANVAALAGTEALNNALISLSTLGAGAMASINQITGVNVGTYIASAAIGDAYIGSLSASKINAGTMNASYITAGTINADRLATGTITAASGVIGNLAITTANIADANITTLKIGANQVTVPAGVSWAGTNPAASTPTALGTLTMNTQGYPVYIIVTGHVHNPYGGGAYSMSLKVDGVTYATVQAEGAQNGTTPKPHFMTAYITSPPSGNFTITANTGGGGDGVGFYGNIFALGTKR